MMDEVWLFVVGYLRDLDYVKCFIISEVDIMYDYKNLFIWYYL